MDIVELKTAAQKEWEERGKDAEPDLALMTQADIHGERSEQQLGRETLAVSQEALMRATGDTTLTEDTRQILMLSVSIFLFISSRTFSGMSVSQVVWTHSRVRSPLLIVILLFFRL